MNSIETTPRFERKFDQDRVEHEPVPLPRRAPNTLRTTKSAPVSSIPRESLLVRSPTSLLTSALDHGLMDMWVDDGTNGNIDDTVRTLRFSTAASAIDGLFHSPTRGSQGSNTFKKEEPVRVPLAPANHSRPSPLASEKKAVSSDSPNGNAKQSSHTDGNSQSPKKAFEAIGDVIVARREAASMIKKQIDILETEPVTPPRPGGKQLGEDTDKSEPPSSTKAASEEHTAPRSSGQHDASENESAPASPGNTAEAAPKSAPQTRRRLSAFFSRNDENPGVHSSAQYSDSQQDLRGSKRESKLQLMNIFKRSSARASKTPPQAAIDSVHSQSNMEPDGRRTDKVLLLSKEESLNVRSTEAEMPSTVIDGKKLSDECKEESARDAEVAKGLNAVSTDDPATPKGSEKPKILNFFKRRATVERPTPVDVESGSGHNTVSSNEQNEPARMKSPRKLVTLVKKLSSGFRDRVGGENKAADEPSSKEPISTAAEATVSSEGKAHAGGPEILETPASEGESPNSLKRKPASSSGYRNATPEQPAQSASDEQAQFAKPDRQLLQKLLKGFSSGSKDRTSESNAEGQEEVGQETPKGAFFAKLFKRKSTNAEEKESETGTATHPERDDAGHTPDSSTPPESHTWWSQLSHKVTRFFGMLVH